MVGLTLKPGLCAGEERLTKEEKEGILGNKTKPVDALTVTVENRELLKVANDGVIHFGKVRLDPNTGDVDLPSELEASESVKDLWKALAEVFKAAKMTPEKCPICGFSEK